MTDAFKGLTKTTDYAFSGMDAKLLETFPSPFFDTTVSGGVHIEAPEFTSLCPITGQPDFAKIVVDYQPNALCVESKSFKLYLNSFRNEGAFHEAIVHKICKDLGELLNPWALQVRGEFTPRGGIPFWPTATWLHQDFLSTDKSKE